MNRHVHGMIGLWLYVSAATVAGAPDTVLIDQAVAAADRSAEDRARDQTDRPAEVLAFFGVRPGMRVVDLMAAGGYYSELLARIVGPEGEVVTQNNRPYIAYAGAEAERRFAGGRLPNVRRLDSELEQLGLEQNAYDMALLVMTYHDIYWVSDDWPPVERDRFFQQIYECLRPGGVVAVIDHAAQAGTGAAAVSELHRIDEEFARRDFESAGFVFDGASDLLRNPDDDRTRVVFDVAIRHWTDRFIFRFLKPPAR